MNEEKLKQIIVRRQKLEQKREDEYKKIEKPRKEIKRLSNHISLLMFREREIKSSGL